MHINPHPTANQSRVLAPWHRAPLLLLFFFFVAPWLPAVRVGSAGSSVALFVPHASPWTLVFRIHALAPCHLF